MTASKMMRAAMAAFAAVLLCACVAAMTVEVQPAFADAPVKGWQTVNGKKLYYKNGTPLIGKQKIGKSYYFFSKKGVMKTGTVKDGATTYYLNSKGRMEAYKVKSTFYKPTGKKMKDYEAKEYRTLLTARDKVAEITKRSDSKATKLLKCFKWVQKGYYHQYRKFRNYEGWAADFANDHFKKKWKGNRSGCCMSDGAAFAYLALAIGYDKVYVGVDKASGIGGHGCAKIGNRYYDPLFAEAKSFSKYYGGKNAGIFNRSVQLLVPSASNGYATSKYIGEKPKSSEAEVNAAASNGLVKVSGSYVYYQKGKKLKGTWKTVKGSRYYFQKNAKAATGPATVKGKRYVFSAKGKLLTGKKTRTVKVSGDMYRVTKTGRAKAGWTSNKQGLYLENGRRATGLSCYKGKLYWFSGKGVYDAEKTRAIQAAAKKEGNAAELLKLIGTPTKKSSVTGCNPVFLPDGTDVWGKDVTYTFKNAKLALLKGEDGVTYFRSASLD